MSADQEDKERNPEIERVIEETRRAIANTEAFLGHLADSNEVSRQHLQQYLDALRQRLERLRAH
ncbi:MAG: hypothetical protein PSX80_10485 [bacterium]|nr:hypothetical protein [bacterium]